VRLACIALFAAIAVWAQPADSLLRNDGPLALGITYRCNPNQRATLRDRMVHGGVANFEGWKKQGILKDFRILFNSYLDSETFDMMALLTFDKFSDVARWRNVERSMPGGLSRETLELVTSAVTTPLDGIRHAASAIPAERGRSVFFIIPYDYLVSTDEYVKYLDTYVIPQVTGWLSENVLAAYTIYLGRYSTSRTWSSIFVLEYRDHNSFGLREATVAKVREKLKSDPSWLAASQSKQKIRVEKQTVIAEELLPQ
jgi:hypothetical protein